MGGQGRPHWGDFEWGPRKWRNKPYGYLGKSFQSRAQSKCEGPKAEAFPSILLFLLCPPPRPQALDNLASGFCDLIFPHNPPCSLYTSHTGLLHMVKSIPLWPLSSPHQKGCKVGCSLWDTAFHCTELELSLAPQPQYGATFGGTVGSVL